MMDGGGASENGGGMLSAASLIELSRKTGLPRGVLPEKEKKEKGEGGRVDLDAPITLSVV